MKIAGGFQVKRKSQGYDARLDESLGGRRSAEKTFRQSLKSRRDESKGMENKKEMPSYDAVHDMDEEDKKRLRHHMRAAHHKFMSHHHRRKMKK